MTDFDNTNSGALFKNDKGDNQNRPDYKGSINVDGTDYWLSAWLKTSKAGKKYMSLSVQHKEQNIAQNAAQGGTGGNAQSPQPPLPDNGFDDDVPF